MVQAHYLPVVRRELKEGARRALNYWLRVAGAGAGVALLFSVTRSAGANLSVTGLQLFMGLHALLLGLICAVVPAMGADCIAAEKREGTLGLLFLTPLDGFGVVLGKAMAHTIRAFMLWLAVLPMLVVPFVMGGVTWGDAFSAVTIEFCTMWLCVAAGIAASALATERSRVFILAECLGVGFVALFAVGLGMLYEAQTIGPREKPTLTLGATIGGHLVIGTANGSAVGTTAAGFPTMPGGTSGLSATTIGRYTRVTFGQGGSMLFPSGAVTGISAMPNGSFLVVRSGGASTVISPYRPILSAFGPAGWSGLFSAPAARDVWQPMLLESLLFIPLVCYGLLRFAGWRVARTWQDTARSARQEQLEKKFCTPLWPERFVREAQVKLDWNPMGWLQQNSWRARMSKWTLCLGFIVVEGMASATGQETMLALQSYLAVGLAAVFTCVGVNSFMTEKKNGALELLLVSPVPPGDIIWSRVMGLWKQFLPTAAALVFFWVLAGMGQPINAAHHRSGALWRAMVWPLRHAPVLADEPISDSWSWGGEYDWACSSTGPVPAKSRRFGSGR